MNAVRSGVTAACVLMPGECLEDRRAQLDAWTATIKPMTQGEGWLGAKIADCMVRLDRLDALVRAAEDAGVESALKKTDAFKKLSAARDALDAMYALAITAEGLTGDVDAGAVSRLAPAMRRCLELAEVADAPMAVLVPLQNAMNGMIVDTVIGVDAGTFQELGCAARATEGALAAIVERTAQEVESERTRLAVDPTLADEEMLKRLDRYRARLMRELDGLLRLLRQVRDLPARPDDGAGSFVHVELRVVGRANLAGA
jgi:hypothetical protein